MVSKKPGGQLKYIANNNIFDNIANNEAYLLGFLVTDGHISNKTKEIEIRLSNKDKIHLENIRDVISPNSPVITRQNGKFEYCRLGFTSYKIYDYLISIGFTHNKTFNPPNLFPIIPKEYHWDYLRGIVDGDGCIYHRPKTEKLYRKNYLSIVSASKEFLIQIQKFLNHGSIYKDANHFVYYTSKYQNIIHICENIYKNLLYLKLDRKYDKYIELTKAC